MKDELQTAADRVAEGDRSAFRTIVEATRSRLYTLSVRMMGSTAEAEDVLQESYVRAYRALVGGAFDGRSSVSTWLYRITANTAIDALRKRNVRSVEWTGDPREGSFDGATSADARLALRQLDEWLSDLPADQRAAVVLKLVEGRSTREVAEIQGCSEGAVEQRLVRARATLRTRREEDV